MARPVREKDVLCGEPRDTTIIPLSAMRACISCMGTMAGPVRVSYVAVDYLTICTPSFLRPYM